MLIYHYAEVYLLLIVLIWYYVEVYLLLIVLILCYLFAVDCVCLDLWTSSLLVTDLMTWKQWAGPLDLYGKE